MDSNKIKNLAYGARDALRAEVSARLDAILAEGSSERLDHTEDVRRIEKEIKETSREKVVDKAAYTWFNRLCALRFMDANGYTPTPVVTPRPGSTQPAILADAAQGVFDQEYNFDSKVKRRVSGVLAGAIPSMNAQEDAFSALLVAVCEYYARPMSYLFENKIASHLLMPQSLLSEGSILRRIVEGMDVEMCKSVEVLGWLYQFYIAERKEEYFKAKRKATVEDIAPATQLFTPNWIVRYMVDNSLGRLWIENNSASDLKNLLTYYIEPESADADYLEISNAEDLTVCDPACGSGHILVYAFDVLFAIYEEEGWMAEDIPGKILKNNLFGFEIDRRAAEIASFALEMKAREKDPHFFDKNIDANIAILEPIVIEADELENVSGAYAGSELLESFKHMDEIGSLLIPDSDDLQSLDDLTEVLKGREGLFSSDLVERLSNIKVMAERLTKKYSVVIANPPYMGSNNMNPDLANWTKRYYLNWHGDLCTCFMKRNMEFCASKSCVAMITASSWMFASSFKKMRDWILDNSSVLSMIQQSTHGYPNVTVPTCMFVISPGVAGKCGTYIRLEDFDRPQWQQPKALEAIHNPNVYWRYGVNPHIFNEIPDRRIGYWASDETRKAFVEGLPLSHVADVKQGLKTGDNNKFLRLWFEVSCNKFSVFGGRKWFPCNKGGDYRRWYGNNNYVINWENDGFELKHFYGKNGKLKSRPQNLHFMFREGLTYTNISSSKFGVRYCPEGFLFDAAGSMIFPKNSNLLYLLGVLSSEIVTKFTKILSPSVSFEVGQIEQIPYLEYSQDKVVDLVSANIRLAKRDWDSSELSWDYEKNPLIGRSDSVEAACNLWIEECDRQRALMHANEQRLDEIFDYIYGFPFNSVGLEDSEITLSNPSKITLVKELISYGVGCIFGRYSLDVRGLVLANAGVSFAEFSDSVPHPSFVPDDDNILPVLDGEWFEDDIVADFYRWLASAFGEKNLDKNVFFIESTLGKQLRNYFLDDFYSDHMALFYVTNAGKRPIYWMFQSPKKGFQCLIYMHRYNEGTVGEILTKYLRPYQEKLRAQVAMLSRSDKARDVKEASKLQARVEELEAWERDVVYPLAHERVSIDLDDGVKVNYNKFPKALAKVQGLSEWK